MQLFKWLSRGYNAPMNKNDLIRIGQALYGDVWQSNLARELDIDSRRVRQWLKDERPIPDWLLPELIKLLNSKYLEIKEILSKINNE